MLRIQPNVALWLVICYMLIGTNLCAPRENSQLKAHDDALQLNENASVQANNPAESIALNWPLNLNGSQQNNTKNLKNIATLSEAVNGKNVSVGEKQEKSEDMTEMRGKIETNMEVKEIMKDREKGSTAFASNSNGMPDIGFKKNNLNESIVGNLLKPKPDELLGLVLNSNVSSVPGRNPLSNASKNVDNETVSRTKVNVTNDADNTPSPLQLPNIKPSNKSADELSTRSGKESDSMVKPAFKNKTATTKVNKDELKKERKELKGSQINHTSLITDKKIDELPDKLSMDRENDGNDGDYNDNKSDINIQPNDNKPELNDQADENYEEDDDATVKVSQVNGGHGSANQGGHFSDDPDSHFFLYFVLLGITLIVGYVAFRNKKRILALIVEGRSPRRRSTSRTRYHKLDNNLEEAMMATHSSGHTLERIY